MKVVIPRTVPRDKKIVFSTPLSEFWMYDQTVRDEKQVWHAFEVLQRICRFTFMNDWFFLKNVHKNHPYFKNFEQRIRKKLAIFKYFFQKNAIIHECARTNPLEDFESMPNLFLISNGLVIHPKLIQRGGKNFFCPWELFLE